MDIKYIIRRFFSKFKPLTIHVECAWDDNIWEEIKMKALSGKVSRWYVMTPTNYTYFKVNFNCKLSKQELEDILYERYRWLLKHNQRLELHLHFDMLNNMSYQAQKILLHSAIRWFKKNFPGYILDEFVSGWWKYNEHTSKLCEEFGLKLIKHGEYADMHDYDLI